MGKSNTLKKILIVEDDHNIRTVLEDDFRLEGYEVISAPDGQLGFELAQDRSLALILLDIMMPHLDGIEVCKALRKAGIDTPIIMLSARGQEVDKIVGLELGADDYVTKPFSPRELQARVKALIRRNHSWSGATGSTHQFGNVVVNIEAHRVLKNNADVRLTALEFSLLKYLLENAGKVISRNEILDAVWSDDVIVDPRTVDAHIAKLRKKIEDRPSRPKWILGVRGAGYKFVGSE